MGHFRNLLKIMRRIHTYPQGVGNERRRKNYKERGNGGEQEPLRAFCAVNERWRVGPSSSGASNRVCEW